MTKHNHYPIDSSYTIKNCTVTQQFSYCILEWCWAQNTTKCRKTHSLLVLLRTQPTPPPFHFLLLYPLQLLMSVHATFKSCMLETGLHASSLLCQHYLFPLCFAPSWNPPWQTDLPVNWGRRANLPTLKGWAEWFKIYLPVQCESSWAKFLLPEVVFFCLVLSVFSKNI